MLEGVDRGWRMGTGRAQTRQPVQWARGVAALADLGCTVLVEIGPTPVLLGMSQSSWPAGGEPLVAAASLPQRAGTIWNNWPRA